MNSTKEKMLAVAKQIRLLLQEQERKNPAPDKERVLQAIKNKITQKQIRKRRIYVYSALSIAATILLILVMNSAPKKDMKEYDLLEFAQKMESKKENTGEEIILQLANKEEVAIKKEEQVEYSANGMIKINQKAITQAKDNSSQKAENAYNQLTVPFGRRTQLHLSDGTDIWINSGTRVVYPVVFDKKTREIFVDGEIYLNVAHDAAHPFIVKTNGFSVQVLGTSFNISAYAKESCSVVLVKGSVNIKDKNEKEVTLLPGQLTDIVDGVAEKPLYTNVEKHISWTDNLLLINNVPLKDVFQKLHLYYGKEFVSSPQIDAIIASGKLELKKNFSDVMYTLTYSVPISYQEYGNKVYLEYNNQKNEID